MNKSVTIKAKDICMTHAQTERERERERERRREMMWKEPGIKLTYLVVAFLAATAAGTRNLD